MYNSPCNKPEKQKHVHEVTGSTATAEDCKDCHSHRFCTISGEAIEKIAAMSTKSSFALIFQMNIITNFVVSPVLPST